MGGRRDSPGMRAFPGRFTVGVGKQTYILLPASDENNTGDHT